MIVLSRQQVICIDGKLTTEASEAGMKPGEGWPDFIAVVNDKQEGLLFGPSFEPMADGGRRYFTRDGIELVVFND